MNAIVNFLERYLVPVAAKVGNQKHLLALRDAFIALLPITFAGSVAVFLNALLRDLPNDPQILGPGNIITNNWLSQQIIGINGVVWNGTLAAISILLVITLGYKIARAYDVDGLAGSIVALASFIFFVPTTATTTTTLALTEALPAYIIDLINYAPQATVSADGTSIVVTGAAWGWWNFASFFNPNGMFTAILTTFISVIIFSYMMKTNFKIKLPDSVPPAVGRAFEAIIPGVVSLFAMALLARLWQFAPFADGLPLNTWVSNAIQQPLLAMAEGYWAVVIVILLVHILWFFGLHGTNIVGAFLTATYGVMQLDNAAAFAEGAEIPFFWVAQSFESFVWPGGAGASLVLIAAILTLSKRSDYRAVAKMGVGPGIFNINEPVMFGLPVVLNPLLFIPFVVAPLVTGTIAYFASMFGLVNPAVIPLSWVMPTILSGFISTAFDWRAIVLSVINLAVAFIIWAPFVLAANRTDVEGGSDSSDE